MIEVIGAGLGRTGTLSLKLALEQLGFTMCYHMMEVAQHPEHAETWTRAHRGEAVDWDELFEGYRATVDWPSCNVWRELMDYYPDARVILTRRDPKKWYASVMSTIYAFSAEAMRSDVPEQRERGRWAQEIVWNRVFDGRMDDEAHVIGAYERHNAEVIASVPAERLLVYEPPYGWRPLCSFLGEAVPDAAYPRVNSSDEFRARRTGSESS